MAVYVLPSWGNGAPAIVIRLPSGYTRETEKRADFDLHYLMHKERFPRIMVYVGHHPNPFSREVKADRKTKRQVKISDCDEEWTEWKDEEQVRGEMVVSRLFPEGQAYSGLMVHISINADSQQQLREAEEWFGKIVLERPG